MARLRAPEPVNRAYFDTVEQTEYLCRGGRAPGGAPLAPVAGEHGTRVKQRLDRRRRARAMHAVHGAAIEPRNREARLNFADMRAIRPASRAWRLF